MLNSTTAFGESNTTYYDSSDIIGIYSDFRAIHKKIAYLAKSLTQSPLNYTCAKFRLLPQILPLFPKDISVMVDLFCGGASVGVNVSARHIILNDKQSELMEILALFQRESAKSLLAQIEDIITDFRLSDSAKFGQRAIKLQ